MRFGAEPFLKSLDLEVTPAVLPLPDFHTYLNYRTASVRACWLWVPDFHSSLSVSDTTSGVRSGGIWFKPAGGYSAAAVKYIITGVIPLLAPRLRPPPSAMQNDFYRVLCSGLWPWKPWVLSDTHTHTHTSLSARLCVLQIMENVGKDVYEAVSGIVDSLHGLFLKM